MLASTLNPRRYHFGMPGQCPPMPRMPEPIENGALIPTLDRQGAVWLFEDEITRRYLSFAPHKTVLEIAAGYGHVALKALEAGAAEVTANEIDAGQLAIIRERTPPRYARQLKCSLGQFPEGLAFAAHSFDAVYCARLFHFFDGARVRAGIERIQAWLRPGGKVFLVNDAVYRRIFRPLIPRYEERVAAGATWPGYFADVRSCIPERMSPQQYPATMNFLDPAVYVREFTLSGFTTEAAAFYPYTGALALARLDGREIAGAIGVRR